MVCGGGRRGSPGPNPLVDFGARSHFRCLLALISLFGVILGVILPGLVQHLALLLFGRALQCSAVWRHILHVVGVRGAMCTSA